MYGRTQRGSLKSSLGVSNFHAIPSMVSDFLQFSEAQATSVPCIGDAMRGLALAQMISFSPDRSTSLPEILASFIEHCFHADHILRPLRARTACNLKRWRIAPPYGVIESTYEVPMYPCFFCAVPFFSSQPPVVCSFGVLCFCFLRRVWRIRCVRHVS